MLFTIGDYVAGMLIGVATALVVRALVWPGMDMVIAMLMMNAMGRVQLPVSVSSSTFSTLLTVLASWSWSWSWS